MVSMHLPTVSDLKLDGTKVVNVYDRRADTYKNIKVTAQEADEFISQRNKVREKASRKGLILGLLGTAIGVACGYKFGKPKEKDIGMILGALGGLITGCLTQYLTGDADSAENKFSAQFIDQNQK